MTPEQSDCKAAREIKALFMATHKGLPSVESIDAIIRANSQDVGKLREALEFYAACPMRTSHDAASFDSASFENDRGQRARAALASVPQPRVNGVREGMMRAAQMVRHQSVHSDFALSHDGAAEFMAQKIERAAESIPAETLTDDDNFLRKTIEELSIKLGKLETLTDELATALTMCAEEVRLNDGSALLYREAQSVLQRYNATKPKP